MTSKQNLQTNAVGKPSRRPADASRRRSLRIQSDSRSDEAEPCVNEELSLLSSVSRTSAEINNASARQHGGRKRRRQSAVNQDHEQASAEFSREAGLPKPSPSGSRQHVTSHKGHTFPDVPHNRHHRYRDCDLQRSSTALVGHDIVANRTCQSKQSKAKKSKAEERASNARRNLHPSSTAVPSADVKCEPQFIEPAVPTKRTRLSSTCRSRVVCNKSQQSSGLSADPCTASTSEPVSERSVSTGTSVRLPGQVGTHTRQLVSFFVILCLSAQVSCYLTLHYVTLDDLFIF